MPVIFSVAYTYLKFMKTDWEQIVASLACWKILWWIWTLRCLYNDMNAVDWTDIFNHFLTQKGPYDTKQWSQLGSAQSSMSHRDESSYNSDHPK